MKEVQDIDLKALIESETGQIFNRYNKINSPFNLSDKTPSFCLYSTEGKEKFKDFSTGYQGDCIDFIMKYKNMDYNEARQYLGLSAEKTEKEIQAEKIINYINWQLENLDNYKGFEFVELYEFTNENNKAIYYKAKLKNATGKMTPYYHINEDGKVKNSRGHEEVPFNLYRLIDGLKSERDIFITEGEKDCRTLSRMGYIATSFKGVKDFNYSIFKGSKVYIIPDNDSAGEDYKNEAYNNLKDYVEEFNVVYPTGWESNPKGYDITDWLEDGHNKDDLKIAMSDKWNLKECYYWRDYTIKFVKEEKKIIPTKTWRNVEQVLKRNRIDLKYNLISSEAEATGTITSSGDELIVDILTLCINNGLNINKDVVCDAILKISRKNCYNPFLDYLVDNRNTNHNLIDDMFNCITINDEYVIKKDTYLKYFKTWLMDLVTMVQNTMETGYKSQGVLVLQGKQGARKSTFFKKLISNNKWFKGEADIDPKNKDSILQNTGYVLVELSEFDGMSKKDQESMKRFLTNDLDVYRVPYGRCVEKHPRITTFCATVNPMDFLKDKTGSRRFFVIPIEKCNIDAMEQIDINQFWGAVYDLWTTGTVKNYLNEEETETLLQDNTAFNMESNISIAIDESFDFEQDKELWKVYGIKEISEIINIYESKAIKTELERRQLKYGAHRDKYSNDVKPKKGFKLPNTNILEISKLQKDLNIVQSELNDNDIGVVKDFFEEKRVLK